METLSIRASSTCAPEAYPCSRMAGVFWRDRSAYLGLSLTLAIWIAWFYFSRPAATFGQYHDDTLLMGSAQALAAGRGYSIPSLPGTPIQTKYPLFYPAIQI